MTTFLFNVFKRRFIWIPLYAFGLGGGLFCLISGFQFLNYTDRGRDKFDMPTAVTFEEGTFQDALTKAKNLDKPIFIDFYTGWCTPCLSLHKNVLTDSEVGKYMNRAFINVKYDAERGEGIELAERYGVKAYPTLVVVNWKGELVESINDRFAPQKEEMILIAKKYIGQQSADNIIKLSGDRQ
ncbi:MAG: thioredoxin family protein, partial [Bacteroidota bacterium]